MNDDIQKQFDDVMRIGRLVGNQSKVISEVLKSEDIIGVGLRTHMLAENILEHHIENIRIAGDIARYVQMPRNYRDKLGLAVATGFPVDLAAFAHCLGKIRNDLAHTMGSSINEGQLAELGRLANAISASRENGSSPIEDRSLAQFNGKSYRYGSGEQRLDFVIIFGAFWLAALEWVQKPI